MTALQKTVTGLFSTEKSPDALTEYYYCFIRDKPIKIT